MKNVFSFFCLFVLLTLNQCKQGEDRCITFECRKKNMVVLIEYTNPAVEEGTKLIVRRKEFYLPKFRVFIGDYDSNFNLPDGVQPQFFEGTDSVATMNLVFETSGNKKVRDIIEEYIFVSEDSIDSYRYPFEVSVNVSESNKE
jgi:hypothetical protein